MPFTPFHFGPGLLFKSILPRYVCFRIFVLNQIIIDAEVLYYMLTQQYPLHRFFHTYLGSTFVAFFCILFGRQICHQATTLWNKIIKSYPIPNAPIPLSAVIGGALLGSWSHVALDSFLYTDIRPLSPLSDQNQMLAVFGMGHVYGGCVLAGLLGWFLIKAFPKLPR